MSVNVGDILMKLSECGLVLNTNQIGLYHSLNPILIYWYLRLQVTLVMFGLFMSRISQQKISQQNLARTFWLALCHSVEKMVALYHSQLDENSNTFYFLRYFLRVLTDFILKKFWKCIQHTLFDKIVNGLQSYLASY